MFRIERRALRRLDFPAEALELGEDMRDTVVVLRRVIDQLVYGLRNRIVHITWHRVGRKTPGRIRRFDESRRDTDRGRTGGHRLHDHRVRTDFRAIADHDWPENFCAGADDDAFTERRVALARIPRRPSERDP